MQLQIKNVSYIYGEGSAFYKKALNNININIEHGEFIAIIGHTGSGKSTLIQHFNGLLKPTSGEILLDGKNINDDKKGLKVVRQRVGLVFQYPEHQLFETTIYKDVAFGPKNMGLNDVEIDKRVREALIAVGIKEEYFEKSPFDLSGGQKRRVAIAGVLAMRPDILILDEPTAGLDPKGRDEILKNIKNLHDTYNITIILVSHSMEDVSRLANRIIVINKGEIILDNTVKNVFKEVELLESTGLGVPQISSLLNSLKEKGYDVPLDVYTIEEATKILYNILK